MCPATAAAADPRSLREEIRARALDLGFDVVGFASARGDPVAARALREMVGEGRHAGMSWLADRMERRADPNVLWPSARTAIVVGLNYALSDPALEDQRFGLVSAYARGRDYHDLVKGRLKNVAGRLNRLKGVDTKVFVDTAPVMEKPLALAAGLGWIGKHTNLVSPELGSWLLLGVMLTTIELPPDRPGVERCGTCRRCLDACPTGAFPEAGKLDARRCLAYLTIEHEGPIPESFRVAMGNRIYGCDACLSACPWNRFARASREVAFAGRVETTAPDLVAMSRLDDQTFRRRFSASPIKRIGVERFVRNVLIALGNTSLLEARSAVAGRLDDPSPVLRDAAEWALARLETRDRCRENVIKS